MPDPPPYRLVGNDGEVLVVEVPVTLGHETADGLIGEIARRLPDRAGAAVVLDFGAVRLVTSIGIAALLQIHEMCADRGAPLRLAAVPPEQRKLLRMLRLESRFEMDPDVDAAVAALGS